MLMAVVCRTALISVHNAHAALTGSSECKTLDISTLKIMSTQFQTDLYIAIHSADVIVS